MVQDITPTLKLLNSPLEISGYQNYVGTYLILGEKKALVDIGPHAAIKGVLAALSEARLSPEEIDYIILTHIHIDHGGGTGTAVKSLKNACVLVHPRGRLHLIDPTTLWNASLQTLGELAVEYGQIEPMPEEKIMVAGDGMKLDLGKGVVLEIYMTPGHAAHHMSIFERTYGVLLAGDSAGMYTNGVLRLTTPPPFRLADYLTSLDRMINLQPKLLGYAHYGCYPDAVARLRATKEKDKDLAYLSALDKDEFERDRSLLVTSIHGMMTARL
jgi:glyoxylase-like metal-dependent hydrolase (beta-lactamase superfamily II)